MTRSEKSNRVPWAPGVNLSQAKAFPTEKPPSQVGIGPEDHFQVKPLWITSVDSDDVPPGFEFSHYANGLKEKVSLVPQMKWNCPPKFAMNCGWQVAAGEESEEAEAQKRREMRVLEAVYPRPSDIPPSPFVTSEMEDEHFDDSVTFVVPLNPIEDEEHTEKTSDLTAPENTPISLHPPVTQGPLPPGMPEPSKCDTPATASLEPAVQMIPDLGADLGADLIMAASVAITAVMKSKEQGSLIDTDMLIKILSDPKMVEKLIQDCEAPANAVSAPVSVSKPVTESISLPCPKPAMVFSPTQPNAVSTTANAVSALVSVSNPVTESVSLPCAATVLSTTHPNAVSAPKRVTESISLPCSKLPSKLVLSPMPPNAVSTPLSVSKGVTESISLPCPNPASKPVLSPTPPTFSFLSSSPPTFSFLSGPPPGPPHGSLHHGSYGVPTTSNIPPQPNVVPVYGFNRVPPPLPFFSPEHIIAAAAANRNLPLLNHMQPTYNTMPARPNFVPMVQPSFNAMPAQPNFVPNMQPSFNTMPTQPNFVPLVQPNLNTMPAQPNSVPQVQPTLTTIPPLPNSVPMSLLADQEADPMQDVNYIKMLIREHGEEKDDNENHLISQTGSNLNHSQNLKLEENLKPGELKTKIQKHCTYFGTLKGCRNGFTCPYLHDTAFLTRSRSMVEDPSAKRTKLGGESSWRT